MNRRAVIAEYVNRSRLGFWPSLWVRYAGLLCIYLSSTIEMFKELVNSNPIYPIALAGLAVAGMLLGILFRVRAFVLTGFMALLIVIFAQIWNAAVLHSHTWVWWACGIILGVIILAMFALFEKHRNEVAKLVESKDEKVSRAAVQTLRVIGVSQPKAVPTLVKQLESNDRNVVIEATHACMTIRGVHKEGSACVTSAMLGSFRDQPATRAEVLGLLRGDRR